jgi:hypothetical protein
MREKLLVTLSLAVGCIGLMVGRSVGVANSSFSPQVVQRVALIGQTGAIPTTTLFTPSQKGLYRVSVYMTTTNLEGGQGSYSWVLNWTDDAGAEIANFYFLSNSPPPTAWGYTGGSDSPGGVATIEALGGQPITYSINGSGETYSLYMVVERLTP